jgi:hypothetical protein
MDVQEDVGENERDQDNRHGGELALLSFDCQVANRPHSTHDLPGCCEDERGGFKVAKVNLPLSEGRLRIFLEGKKIS